MPLTTQQLVLIVALPCILLGMCYMMHKSEQFAQCPGLATSMVSFVDKERAFDNHFVRPDQEAPVAYIEYPMNRLPH